MRYLSIVILILGIVACGSTTPAENSREITPQLIKNSETAEDQCIDQVALALDADAKKHKGSTEQEILDKIKKYRRVMLKVGNEYPEWLYVRYQQITRDVFRRDRDIETYGKMIYQECMLSELYITKEE